MTYLEAAVVILKASGAPLTAAEITKRAVHRDLIQPSGKTPEATMSARLYVESRRNPGFPIRRVFDPGAQRARRGSVRWTYLR